MGNKTRFEEIPLGLGLVVIQADNLLLPLPMLLGEPAVGRPLIPIKGHADGAYIDHQGFVDLADQRAVGVACGENRRWRGYLLP
jgi:hypothetical protein